MYLIQDKNILSFSLLFLIRKKIAVFESVCSVNLSNLFTVPTEKPWLGEEEKYLFILFVLDLSTVTTIFYHSHYIDHAVPRGAKGLYHRAIFAEVT